MPQYIYGHIEYQDIAIGTVAASCYLCDLLCEDVAECGIPVDPDFYIAICAFRISSHYLL